MANPQSPGSVIVILGMHRSGTSLCARVINLLGASLSKNLLVTRPDNPRGYFEDRKVVEVNSKIIRAIFAEVHEPAYPLAVQMRPWPLPENWMLRGDVLYFRSEMLDYVREQTSGNAPWCLKDPRLCRLLPFWMDIFKELNLKVRIVLAIRNPAHVSASLARRDGFFPDQVELQWLSHVLDAVYHSQEHSAVVDYEDWFSDPTQTIVKLAVALGLRPDKSQVMSAFSDIEHKLNHSPDNAEIIHPFAQKVYELLQDARFNPLQRDALLYIRKSLNSAFALLTGCYAELAFAANQQHRLMEKN